MGFRKYRSCLDNLVLLENVIQNGFAVRKHTVAIFFDLEKAYDRTRKYTIVKQLYDWGLRGNLLRFIDTFLSSHSFKVRIGNALSNTHILENGIPQASPLSVTLFAAAVNNLLNSVNHSVEKCMYVDDLAIFYSSNSMEDIENTATQR